MANVLAIDFDVEHLHIVAGQTRRKDVVIEKTWSWKLPELLTPVSADSLGKSLRGLLQEQGMLAGSVLVTLPRDQLLLKELQYPPVAAYEELNLVRFQLAKELTEPLDNMAFDFLVKMERPGNRETLAVLAKRNLVTALTNLCRSAGLKLLGITPRYFGALSALHRSQEDSSVPMMTATSEAVFLPGSRTSEIVIGEQGAMTLTRGLPGNGAGLGELRRTLSVYAAQRSADPKWEPLRRVSVIGRVDFGLREGLETSGFEVDAVSVGTNADALAVQDSTTGDYVASIGILHLWASQGKLPINLAIVRKVQVPVSATRQRGVVYGGLAALVILLAMGTGWIVQNRQQSDLRLLRSEILRKETKLASLSQDKLDIEFLKDWEQASVPWLDELYDITARFPDQVGLRVNQLTATAAPLGVAQTKRLAKDQFVGVITVNGIVAPDQSKKVIEFNNNLSAEKYVQAIFEHNKRSGNTSPEDFLIKINVKRRPQEAYTANLRVPAKSGRFGAPSTTETVPMPTETEDTEGEDR